MFWRVIGLIELVLRLIHEAEEKLGPGTGPSKRSFVLDRAMLDLTGLGAAAPAGGCGLETIVSYVGQLVDTTVSLLNCLGVFEHAPASSAAAAPPAAVGAPTEDPPPKV